jgi:NAD(P)-dependent dehydrogenase (short-subunit alcohol dehydrogenase family)
MDRQKNAIVTGAASGLGRALAVALGREGWCIALADVNTAGSEETLRLVRQAGGDGSVEELDVRHVEEWQALRDRLKARWENLDLLANNAGVAGSGFVGEYSIDDWRWIIDVNLWNGINGCHTFVDWLKSNPRGAHILNTCSLAAIVSAPTMAAYNVTKAGMLALSETLYSELMPYNVGVTAICPAVFRTNLLDSARWCREEERRLFQKGFEQAKMTAEDVARAAIRAMKRKQLYVVVPFESRMHWYLKRLAPTWLLKKIARMFEAGLKASASGVERQPAQKEIVKDR